MTDDEQRLTASYERMVRGHVYIADTIRVFLGALRARIERLQHSPRILELGSHGGFITQRILDLHPDSRIVVCDTDEHLLAVSRRKLEARQVDFHSGPLEELPGMFDLVVSVARHHHLPHGYLPSVLSCLKPGGAYVLADELCPEYCAGEHAERIAQAELLHIHGGYVFTSAREAREFAATGNVPPHVVELERLRQRALWHWYRFVVDEAVKREYFDVAVHELQSTHDDLITGSAAEHKFSPAVVEREFELAGFERLSKQLVGPAEDPARQSMFVYEFARGTQPASTLGVT